MFKKIVILSLLAINVSASSFDFVETIRPHLEKLIGSDFTTSILGEPARENQVQVVLPEIPVISENTKSTEVFKNKFKEKNIINSADKRGYDYNFLKELFLVTRNVKADDVQIGRWMNALDQGGSREGVYRALVLDSYYANLENYNQPLSQETITYSIAFFKKFLGKELNSNQFQGMNIYSVKRIITENSLDILDIYLQRNQYDNFISWYSLFSAHVAQTENLWQSKMRQSRNVGKHMKWASEVPSEFVKSEVIIKIHQLFNYLQLRK